MTKWSWAPTLAKNWSQNNDIIKYAKTVRATFKPFVLPFTYVKVWVCKIKMTFMLYTCLFQVKQQRRPQNNTKQQMNKCNYMYLIIIANLPIRKTTRLIFNTLNPMKSNRCLHVNLKLHEAQINNTWNLSGTSVNLISLSLSVKWLLSNSSGS